MSQPLTGLKVLDLTRFLAGPFCTMILADMGADVVKVETPDGGDDLRSSGPFIEGESAGFLSLNRNKKSLALNLRDKQGKDIFRRLVKRFDVVVENFRPGVMKKLGLDYLALRNINRRMIYAAVSGFGQTGPHAHRAAFDFIISGYSGIMSISAHPGGEPIRVGVGLVDILSGMFTTIGILSALRYRDISGEGQMVDVGMLDSTISLMENPIARYFATGQNPPPPGNQHPFNAPMGVFPAKDGFIIIAVGNENLWLKFCQAINREDLLQSPDFKTNTERMKNRPKLHETLSKVLEARTIEEWIKILDKAGIPCGPLNTVDKALQEPQVLFRNMIVDVEHPKAGSIKMTGTPIKLSSARDDIFEPPALLGQHTDEVLQGYLDMGTEQLEAMRKEGVVR
jgi:CoA:oxalate CoA-transferase